MPGMVQVCRPRHPQAEFTAAKVNRFVDMAHRKLADHPLNRQREINDLLPANGVITRGAGSPFHLENIVHDGGIRAAVVAGCNTVIGLSRMLGFTVIKDSRFTADAGTDLNAKMSVATRALSQHDLVYVHVKAPDLFSHDLQPQGKRDFLQRLDGALEGVRKSGAIIAIAADHSTSSVSGAHTDDPVPVLLYDPAGEARHPSPQTKFGESSCRHGTMPRQSSNDFLNALIRRMKEPGDYSSADSRNSA